MKTILLENTRQLEIRSVEQSVKQTFKGINVQFSNSITNQFDDLENIITVANGKVKLELQDDFAESDKLVSYLETLLAPNYKHILLEFANKFKAIEGATVVETEPSSVSIHINGVHACGFILWLNEKKEPREIEIIPAPSAEGDVLAEWVMKNKRDILNVNIYVAGKLKRMVSKYN